MHLLSHDTQVAPEMDTGRVDWHQLPVGSHYGLGRVESILGEWCVTGHPHKMEDTFQLQT